jgi:hypothetical protein
MEELDKLAADFAARGCAPDGAGAPDEHAPGHTGHGPDEAHGHGAVRRFTHRGHEVEIVTRYEIASDGERWNQQLGSWRTAP